MNLSEAITLAVSHHPAPYRQIKHYWKWKIIFAGMHGDILTVTDKDDESRFEYDRESFLNWLCKQRGQIIPVHFDADIKMVLHGKDKKEVSELVNSAIRDSLIK